MESTDAGPLGTERVSLASSDICRIESHTDANLVRYIFPPKLRAGVSEIWQIPEVNHWWLPDEDTYPNIMKEIRALTEERTTNPRDNFREDIRDMKSLFGKLNLDDAGSQNSSPSVDSSGVTEPSPDQLSNCVQAWQQQNLQAGDKDPPPPTSEGPR